MADTVDPPETPKGGGSQQGERARLEALTRTLEARDLASTREHWPDALSPGSILGPYRIVRLLGQGGMGVVYEAEEIETGRRVALKVLASARRCDVDRERFLREGRLAASLNHPHCVFVFGAWEIDGELVIAMELMRDTLADRLEHTGRLPFAVAVDAILQVSAGLEAAAAAGILHRDVKPSNCFVDEQGRVKIGDFGISISALTTSERGLATGRRIVGTPGYASPEQLRGDDVDVRIRHLWRRRHALRAGHRTPALRQARSDVAADGGGERERTGAASPGPDDSPRPEPDHRAGVWPRSRNAARRATPTWPRRCSATRRRSPGERRRAGASWRR